MKIVKDNNNKIEEIQNVRSWYVAKLLSWILKRYKDFVFVRRIPSYRSKVKNYRIECYNE